MAVQSQIPRRQMAAASPAPSARSTPSPELKTAPKSKIPSRPGTPSSDLQSRLGWRPAAHWKPPGVVDGRPQHPGHASPGPDSPSSANTSRLPRIIPWLTSKASKNQTSSSRVSSISSSSKNSILSSKSKESDSSSKRDWKETWWGDSGIPLLDLMRQQNPNPDRSPAIVGEPDNSKRFVKLLNPYGRPIGPDSQDPIAQLVYPKQVDWFERDDVSGLNKWRKAVFEHYLGPAQIEEPEWHPLEDEFILREYGELVKQAEELQCFESGVKNLPSWAKITRDFNRRFEGRKLDATESRLSRSKVTREMLRKRYIDLRNSERKC